MHISNLGRTSINPKLKNNYGMFFQALTKNDRFRDIGAKPPKNAGVGENQPHWKTVKCNFIKKLLWAGL